MEIIEALEAFEAELNLSIPKGASKLPLKIRYQVVLTYLRDRLCPQFTKTRDVLKGEKVVLATAIADAISLYVAALNVPAASIARSISIVGIDKFCEHPASILPEMK